jgi:hypothetical protein
MKQQMFLVAVSLALLALAAMPTTASAHGFAGKRFFPATLATDDPFVADELSLPTVSTIRTPAVGDEPSTRETAISVELAKRITPSFGVSIAEEYRHLSPEGESDRNGFGNLELGFKYQFYKSDLHETILSAGLSWEVGGTGRKSVDADSFSTFTPTLFFGKGFGDMFDGAPMLKPVAMTGTLGVAMPTRASSRIETVDPDTGQVTVDVERNPDVLLYGLAIEYSLIYLQSAVKDISLPAPLNRMIPLVEFAFETPLDRGHRGETTATMNPGVLWAGRYIQLGIEAIIPLNDRTGNNVGVLAQLHFFIDDLFPRSFGRPLFGSSR